MVDLGVQNIPLKSNPASRAGNGGTIHMPSNLGNPCCMPPWSKATDTSPPKVGPERRGKSARLDGQLWAAMPRATEVFVDSVGACMTAPSIQAIVFAPARTEAAGGLAPVAVPATVLLRARQ